MVSVTKMPVWSSSGTFVQDTHRNYLAEGVELYKNTVNWGKMAVRSTYQELSGTVSKETYQWRARNRDNHPIKAQYTDAMIEHGMYLNEGKKHALYTLGRGFKQLSLELGEKIGIDPGSAARYTAYINEQAYLYSLTPAAHSTCGQWGNGVTHMAIFLLPGGAFLQGTRTILWGMGTAGFTAALYPTQDGLLSTRLGVAMDTAALTGLMGVGLSYAVPAAQSFAPYLYNRARNAFGSVNSIKQVNGDVVLNADLMERAQAVVQQLESSSLNSARQSIIALDTPALIVTKTTATPVNQASAKIVINSDVRLPYSNSTVKSVIKAPTTEGVSVAQLSDVGIYKPEPLMLSERVRIGTWEKARNQYLKNWRNVNVEKISKESQRLLLNSGADEVIKRNMKPDDLAGIFKEARNVKIFDSKGKLVNHLDEWNQASNAMTKLLDTDKVSSIHGRLGVLYKQGQYSSKEAELLRQKLSDLSKLKDTYTKLIEVQKCQINNKFQH